MSAYMQNYQHSIDVDKEQCCILHVQMRIVHEAKRWWVAMSGASLSVGSDTPSGIVRHLYRASAGLYDTANRNAHRPPL